MKDKLSQRDKLRKSLSIYLSLAVLGLGAACAHVEPTALPTFTPVPTIEPTSTLTAFERNCAEIPEATRIVAVASTILGSLYAQMITPGQVDICIPIVVVIDDEGSNCFLTDDLLEGRISGKLANASQTELCYGKNIEAVLNECSTANP